MQDYKTLNIVVERKKGNDYLAVDHVTHANKDGYYCRMLAPGQVLRNVHSV